MSDLTRLLELKRHNYSNGGFAPKWMPDQLFDFQRALVDWALWKGRCGLYEDCGLGKSPQAMTWAENVVRHTNKPVLLMTPIGVGKQMLKEAAKFGMEAIRSNDGKIPSGARIVITNYERLHYFNTSDFSGCVCDESSILKGIDGVTRAAVTDFMRKMSYRLLCTATPAPNDLIELGTSSEALGYMGFSDMLTTFFKKAEKASTRADEFRHGMWRFKGHAEMPFFRWVCSWARAVRKPSDLGFSDERFILPELISRETVVESPPPPDCMFTLPASGLKEQRQERRRSLEQRCEAAASLINPTGKPAVAWCDLNDEGAALKRMIPDAVEVSGADSLDEKEEMFDAFVSGQIRVMVTKGDIAGMGLNWQHCAHQTFFPSHSYESFYQRVRRSWRFGQKNPVTIDMITSEGQQGVMDNLMRKSENADRMFSHLVRLMGEANSVSINSDHNTKTNLPSWL